MYRRDFEFFQDFCELRNEPALPASSATILAYLAFLSDKKSPATISRALTSINKAHLVAGLPAVVDPAVSATMKGIRREKGVAQVKAKGISYADIVKMASLCEPSMIGTRDKAILLIGWASAMRRSEIVALNMGDLEFNERGVIVCVRRSKTDQDGQGAVIAIPYMDGPTCPVEALKKWIGLIEVDEREPERPVFRSVGKGGNSKWYIRGRFRRLNDRMISVVVKKYAKLAGLPHKKYSAHSLRRGFATEAGSRLIPERIIARHTRHRSIAVLREYIESGNVWEENPLCVIYPTITRPLSGFFQNRPIAGIEN
jgi:integrase